MGNRMGKFFISLFVDIFMYPQHIDKQQEASGKENTDNFTTGIDAKSVDTIMPHLGTYILVGHFLCYFKPRNFATVSNLGSDIIA